MLLLVFSNVSALIYYSFLKKGFSGSDKSLLFDFVRGFQMSSIFMAAFAFAAAVFFTLPDVIKYGQLLEVHWIIQKYHRWIIPNTIVVILLTFIVQTLVTTLPGKFVLSRYRLDITFQILCCLAFAGIPVRYETFTRSGVRIMKKSIDLLKTPPHNRRSGKEIKRIKVSHVWV